MKATEDMQAILDFLEAAKESRSVKLIKYNGDYGSYWQIDITDNQFYLSKQLRRIEDVTYVLARVMIPQLAENVK